MAFLLQTKIFGYFGRDIKIRDEPKNAQGKGVLERYNEVMGLEYDVYYSEFLDNLIDNTMVPQEVLEKFIPYLEEMLGGLQFTGTTIAIRRKILKFAIRLYEIKGTKKSYDLIYRLLGFNSVTITEHQAEFTFDSPTTFDDLFRKFDSKCPPCSDYTINVYGDADLTNELHKMIFRAAELCEPINAHIRAVFYNDVLLIADDLPSIFVDGEGDLIYDDVASPDIVFTMDDEGNLIVNTPGFDINEEGDIIFTE